MRRLSLDLCFSGWSPTRSVPRGTNRWEPKIGSPRAASRVQDAGLRPGEPLLLNSGTLTESHMSRLDKLSHPMIVPCGTRHSDPRLRGAKAPGRVSSHGRPAHPLAPLFRVEQSCRHPPGASRLFAADSVFRGDFDHAFCVEDFPFTVANQSLAASQRKGFFSVSDLRLADAFLERSM